ncbi:MAG: hypothetical protein JWR18_460 [Segetibacter sp.]|jgi:hypothetical protein|nr:hypothetical protein [Segetibacter sp.]
MKWSLQYLAVALLVSTGCSTISETSKHQMETGTYTVKNYNNRRFYVDVKAQSLTLNPLTKTKAGWVADTSTTSVINISTDNPADRQQLTFANRSFDLDVMSILFKYRPYTAGFPNQLNTNFNAAEFVGYRSDLYILSYDKNPLNSYHRRMNHFAFSLGGFIGLGATQMNPFVTNNYIQSEYDGFIVSKGIAALVGVGEFTFGTALGFDHLMDNNHKRWIYQGTPWLGFTVGFNIN